MIQQESRLGVADNCGAKEVYFVSACPPVKNPCYYGVDMPTSDELIAGKQHRSKGPYPILIFFFFE